MVCRVRRPSMYECGYDQLLPAGTWYLWKTGKVKVFLACPSCAGVVVVELDDVNEDGTLVKTFRCHKRVCTFSGSIKLKEWPKTSK